MRVGASLYQSYNNKLKKKRTTIKNGENQN